MDVQQQERQLTNSLLWTVGMLKASTAWETQMAEVERFLASLEASTDNQVNNLSTLHFESQLECLYRVKYEACAVKLPITFSGSEVASYRNQNGFY